MATVVVDRSAPVDSPSPAISWGAVLAGAAVAGATTLALLVLAAGLGLTLVSPWYDQNASGATFAISGAVALIVIQWLASALGGYTAGRLRPDWVEYHEDETFFRDTAHGFLVWCVASLILFACAMGMAGSAARNAASAVGQAAAPAVQTAAQRVASQADYYADVMLRPSSATSPSAGLPDAHGEIGRLATRGLTGELTQADKAHLAEVVASRTGLTPEQAAQRVNDVATQIQSVKAKAQEAAEQARKAASRAALFTFLSLVMGAFIAAVAGAYGGSLRKADGARYYI